MMNEKQDGHPEEALSAYLDGELEPAERAAIEVHLRGCAACADLLEDLRHLDAAAAEELPPPVPADLAGRISRRLAPSRVVEVSNRRWTLRPWFGPIPIAAAATLAAVAVLATVRLLGPEAVREAALEVPAADEALRPVPKEKGEPEGQDVVRERRAAEEDAERRAEPQAIGYGADSARGLAPAEAERDATKGRTPEVAYKRMYPADEKKGGPSDAAARDAEPPTEGAEEAGTPAEERLRLDRSRIAPAETTPGERASSLAQHSAEPPPSAESAPKGETGRGEGAPAAMAAAPKPGAPTTSEPGIRPSAAAPPKDAVLEESLAEEDDLDAARSLAAPERFHAKTPESGVLSVLGDTEGPGEARMVRAGTIARRAVILETPGYQIAVTEDGDLEVHAEGYQCAVAAEAPAEEGARAGRGIASAHPVAEKAVGVPAEIADLFRLAALLREASEREDSREDRAVAEEAAESPWAVSLIEPGKPLLRVDASADWNLMGALPSHDAQAQEIGNADTMRVAALRDENTRRHLATWLAGRICALARRDYATLLQNQCGPLPEPLASGD